MEFTLYSRSNCHLCDAMEDELKPFIVEHGIVVKRQYIDNEPALKQLYGAKIPVLLLNEKILCHYFLDADLLYKAIADNAGA